MYQNSGSAKPFTIPSSHIPASHDPSNNRGFKFNQVLYENSLLVRVKCPDREEYAQNLNIKMVLHAQQASSQQ
jgi:hypothetical protein